MHETPSNVENIAGFEVRSYSSSPDGMLGIQVEPSTKFTEQRADKRVYLAAQADKQSAMTLRNLSNKRMLCVITSNEGVLVRAVGHNATNLRIILEPGTSIILSSSQSMDEPVAHSAEPAEKSIMVGFYPESEDSNPTTGPSRLGFSIPTNSSVGWAAKNFDLPVGIEQFFPESQPSATLQVELT